MPRFFDGDFLFPMFVFRYTEQILYTSVYQDVYQTVAITLIGMKRPFIALHFSS